MKSKRLVRRYIPFAALVVVQVLIIVFFPSTTTSSGPLAASSGTALAYSTGGSTGPGGAGLSVTHCDGNREFSPSIDYYAPLCTPGPVGPSNFANGGATYEGVTAKAITIVDYDTNYGAEVDAILQSQGTYESLPEAQEVDRADQNFINSHYVLWGRQIHIVTYQGECTTVPPDYNCLEAEMSRVVATYHPFAVYWGTTICSACFSTLAADHVIAFGGEGFSDAFADANAPYFYSADESSTHMEEAFADWYCQQMRGPVQFAPDNNPQQDFDGRPRVLGVISTNDPDNENTVRDVLVPALRADCGVTIPSSHFYFYDENVNTAAQQVEAGISAMDTTTDPATDVLCLCDSVAPEFLLEGEQQHNFWPENLLADVQEMTNDLSGQSDQAGPNDSASLACPTPKRGCEFDDAIGLSSIAPQQSEDDNAGVRVFEMGGGTKLPVSGLEAQDIWMQYEMIASLIENTGPDLTPARMEAAAPGLGTIGGGTTGRELVGFSNGDYSWDQDAQVGYWDPNRVSPYNGEKGTFVPIEGRRFLPDQYPHYSQPPVPAVRPS